MKFSRVKKILTSAALLVMAISIGDAAPAPPLPVTAIRHVTIVDVTGGPAQTDMTVIIAGSRIAKIGDSDDVEIPKNAKVIDAPKKFLIPGLWDMHVHVAGVSADPAWSKDVLLPVLVANGITGIRDMGGDLDALLEWRREIDRGDLLGPQIVTGGPMLVPAGTGSQTDPSLARVGTAEEARTAVDELKKRGADFIKVIDLPRDAYFAVADEAKKQNIPFVGHIPSEVTALEASKAGQRSIEHIIYSSIAFDCSSRGAALRKEGAEASAKGDGDAVRRITDEANASFDPARAAALWKTFVQNGTWETPTLEAIHANGQHPDDSATDPRLAFLPASLRTQWAPPAEISQARRDAAAWWQRQFANDLKLTGEMHRAGVRLLAGSDSLDQYVFVGDSLHRELQWLVKAGLTPLEALQAATRNAAEFLGRKDFGAVAPGKRADLVILDADPLADIGNTSKISTVILAGKVLAKADLEAMLAKAQAAAGAVK